MEADTEFARYGLASAQQQAQLVLDDVFLARRIADVSAELLQTIVHQRYKLRRSIVITFNRVVQNWGKYLADATMATTILDRLMHRCAMLEFEGKSYRLKEAAAHIVVTGDSSQFACPPWGSLTGHKWGKLKWPSGPLKATCCKSCGFELLNQSFYALALGRHGNFEPQIIPKHQTRWVRFDQKILFLYARGMAVREI